MPKNANFSYVEHDRFSLEEMNDDEFLARYNPDNLTMLTFTV